MERWMKRKESLDGSVGRLCEKREAYLLDLAALLVPSPVWIDRALWEEMRELYQRLTSPSAPLPACHPDNEWAVRTRLSVQSEEDRIALCRQIARKVGFSERETHERLISAFFSQEETEAESGEVDMEMDGNRVSYLRSSYADRAYRIFSDAVPELRADYASSFAGVCESVYDNRAKLCILPLETTTSGSLTGFRGLIARHGLKIIATCDVATGEEEITRFALLKKNLYPIPGQKNEASESFFRISLMPSPEFSLQRALTAAAAYGLEVYKIDTVPISYTEGGFAFDLTLRAQGDLAAMLLYLTLEAPQYEAVGFWFHFGT